MFTPNGAINEMNVDDFEKAIGFSLPRDYRDFLTVYSASACQINLAFNSGMMS